jgi:hypothetical protein
MTENNPLPALSQWARGNGEKALARRAREGGEKPLTPTLSQRARGSDEYTVRSAR